MLDRIISGAVRYRWLVVLDAIVLADFANTTGETVFDQTLRQGLAVQLGQSPFLTIVPDHRLRRTLQLMGQPRTAALTDEIARDACVRTGGTVMVAGSIARLGSQYVLGLRAGCRFTHLAPVAVQSYLRLGIGIQGQCGAIRQGDGPGLAAWGQVAAGEGGLLLPLVPFWFWLA